MQRGGAWWTRQIVGWLLTLAVAGLMILSGGMKLSGKMPPLPPEELAKEHMQNIGKWMQVIAVGEIAAAAVFLLPRTMSLGTLLVSGFWGGTISFHMAKGDPIEGFAMQIGMLVATWVAASLRDFRTLGSFAGRTPVGP